VWDAASGKELAKLQHEGSVSSAAFSTDGQRVVTASDDGTARVWDAASGKELAKLQHQGNVLSAAFNADGQRAVTASRDGTARVWNMRWLLAGTDELLEAVCQEKLVGAVVLTPADVDVSPILSRRKGESVCPK
jgi:WD40 repeat protein